jgi:hypothetical protein
VTWVSAEQGAAVDPSRLLTFNRLHGDDAEVTPRLLVDFGE